jgi:transcriptional regulator
MIYSPTYYYEHRKELIYEIIRDYSFATIISQTSDGPIVSHLPLLLETTNEKEIFLLGHCAKANPHWKQFVDGQKLTAIFHGPHSYISPAWYEPKPDNVPTWNYATVHTQGIASVISAPEKAFEILRHTVQHFENKYSTGWSLPEVPNKELSQLLHQIVAFKIEVKDIQAKFKLSQKQNATDRNNVVENLSKMNESQRDVAKLMYDVLESGVE